VIDRKPISEKITRAALRALLIATCAILAGIVGCGGLPPVDDTAEGGTVVVLAVEEDTGAPLPVPAEIIVGGVRDTLRPADEQLVLSDVPIGTGTPPTQPLTATAEGYVTRTQQVQMQVTTATWVTVNLVKADPETTGTVPGTVVDADTGDPVRNAFVQFTPPDDGDAEGVGGYSDLAGSFIIGGIPEGPRVVTVQAEGFLPFAPTTVTIVADADGENEDLRFELVAGDTSVPVTGTVVDVLTRRAIAGAEVTVGAADPVVSGPDGRFRAEDVLVGDREITVTADGYEELTTVVRVLPGMGDITLEMITAATDPPGSPYTIAGTVTLNGPPDSAGATVRAVSLRTGSALDDDETDAAGRYELFVPPGRYELTVTFGERQISREVTVPEGGVIVDNVNFVLTVQ
jgi:hypothetical protein